MRYDVKTFDAMTYNDVMTHDIMTLKNDSVESVDTEYIGIIFIIFLGMKLIFRKNNILREKNHQFQDGISYF